MRRQPTPFRATEHHRGGNADGDLSSYETRWTKGGYKILDNEGMSIAVMITDVFPTEVVEKSARQFAKSPEMLESLQSLLSYCRDLAALQDEYPECVRKAEQIVLELTGELPEPKRDDGWIEWHGGECPVSKGTRVKYLMRDENRESGGSSFAAEQLRWKHLGRVTDIVAYRVLP